MIVLHRYADIEMLDEIRDNQDVIVLALMAICLFFVLLFLRNFWNWIQKRRYKSKYNNILVEYDNLFSNHNSLIHSKETLLEDFQNLKSVNLDLKNKKADNKKYFEESRKKVQEKHNKELEDFKHERIFYKETIEHNEVQVSNTRLGAHFLKNVLFKIQQEYQSQSIGKFNVFGQVVTIEKKNKKELLPIDVLINLNALLDYNVSTMNIRKINLNDEIIHVKTFLEIIQFLKPKLKITHNFYENYKNFEISPTLLFPFLENTLKHGDLNSDDSFLNIELIDIKNSLLYRITNSAFNLNNKENKQGFGLESLEKALRTYYKTYELDLHENGNEYISELKVEL